MTEESKAFTIRELYDLPAAVDLMTAARALHMGRTMAYELVRRGEFPCRLLRYGGTYQVATVELLELLSAPLPTGEASVGDESTWRLVPLSTWRPVGTAQHRGSPRSGCRGVPRSDDGQKRKSPALRVEKQGSDQMKLGGRTRT